MEKVLLSQQWPCFNKYGEIPETFQSGLKACHSITLLAVDIGNHSVLKLLDLALSTFLLNTESTWFSQG